MIFIFIARMSNLQFDTGELGAGDKSRILGMILHLSALYIPCICIFVEGGVGFWLLTE